MKKPFFSFLLLFFTFLAAHAQTERGTWLLSGSVNYSLQKFNYGTYQNETNTFTIQPQAGVFVANHLVVGIAPMFSYNYETNHEPGTANYSITNSMAGGGIFARYYLMFNSQVGFFPQVGVDYASGLKHNSSNYIDAQAIPNLVFFPLPKIGVSLGLGNIGYLHQKNADGSNSNTIGFGINGNGLTVGLSYHFVR